MIILKQFSVHILQSSMGFLCLNHQYTHEVFPCGSIILKNHISQEKKKKAISSFNTRLLTQFYALQNTAAFFFVPV